MNYLDHVTSPKNKKASSIIKGRPLPSEMGAKAIEHVIQYGGKHLRPASIDMSMYELYI